MLIFKLPNLAIKIEECAEVVSSYSYCRAGKITTKTKEPRGPSTVTTVRIARPEGASPQRALSLAAGPVYEN